MRRRSRKVVLLGALMVALGAPAAQAQRSGSGTDPAGDTAPAGQPPARDFLALEATASSAGNVRGTVTLGAAATGPGDDANLQIVLGRSAAGDCGDPAAGLLATTRGANPRWIMSGEATTRPATVTLDGAKVTLEASSRPRRERRCAATAGSRSRRR